MRAGAPWYVLSEDVNPTTHVMCTAGVGPFHTSERRAGALQEEAFLATWRSPA
jgi:hypothetical protein